ncbi:MAG: hypothetical protein WD267_06575 [Balneolales bacterium]
MRTSQTLLLGCTVLLLIYSVARLNVWPETNMDSINAVLGDESYISTFGQVPNSSVTDAKRIYTHLSYVEDILRNSLPNDITPKQKEQRLAFLDHLRDYRMEGNFPVNDDHPDFRRPTFISDNGNICAVGYLVEQSAGRAMAEQINNHYKYSYITAIDDPAFLDWVEESGFSVEELAMIQPGYESVREVHQNNNHLEAPYIATSGVTLTANALYWSQEITDYTPLHNNNVRQWAGLAIGTGSVLFGTLNVNTKSRWQVTEQSGMWYITTKYVETNHLKTVLSSGHIIAGTATLLRSAWNLLNATSQREIGESGLLVTNFTLPHANGTHTVSGIGYRFTFN